MLDILGLDETTYAVYRLWLRRRDLTVDEVADALGQAPDAVRRARDRLVELSLLIPSRDRPGHLLAVPPDGVLEQLLRQQHQKLQRRQEQLARAREQVTALLADYTRDRRGAATGEVDRVERPDDVRAHLLGLIGRAEREVLVLRTRRAAAPDGLAELERVEVPALRRGVAMRGVHPPTAWADGAASAYARAVAAHGFALRIAEDPAADVTVVDGAFGLVLTPPGSADGGALILRTPAVTRLAVALFERVWAGATPFGSDAVGPGAAGGVESRAGPTDQERALLMLLSVGAKDEAAARQLGVSVRTVRRMIADLMRELDARSRFQAGVIATQRGWL